MQQFLVYLLVLLSLRTFGQNPCDNSPNQNSCENNGCIWDAVNGICLTPPSVPPTDAPTDQPVAPPTAAPTDQPIPAPTAVPTAMPTNQPTQPTCAPLDEVIDPSNINDFPDGCTEACDAFSVMVSRYNIKPAKEQICIVYSVERITGDTDTDTDSIDDSDDSFDDGSDDGSDDDDSSDDDSSDDSDSDDTDGTGTGTGTGTATTGTPTTTQMTGACTSQITSFILGLCENDRSSISVQELNSLIKSFNIMGERNQNDLAFGAKASGLKGIRVNVPIGQDPVEFKLCLSDEILGNGFDGFSRDARFITENGNYNCRRNWIQGLPCSTC